jgi:hypothetical protein
MNELHLVIGKVHITGPCYVDHIVKQAIAALKYEAQIGEFKTIDLFILTKDASYSRVVRPIKDNPNLEVTIENAIKGIRGEQIWKESAIPSWLQNQSETTKDALIDMLGKMKITLTSYQELGERLIAVETNPTATKLTADLLQELRNRGLYSD